MTGTILSDVEMAGKLAAGERVVIVDTRCVVSVLGGRMRERHTVVMRSEMSAAQVADALGMTNFGDYELSSVRHVQGVVLADLTVLSDGYDEDEPDDWAGEDEAAD